MANQQQRYQIGAGLPVNQQYLQPHEARPASSHSNISHQQQHLSYAAPPAPQNYDPQAPDIPTGAYEAYRPPPGYHPGVQEHQTQQPQDQKLSKEYSPPPMGASGATGQTQQYQQFAPPPFAADGQPGATQQFHLPPKDSSIAQDQPQQFPPPPTAGPAAQGYGQEGPPAPTSQSGAQDPFQHYPPSPNSQSLPYQPPPSPRGPTLEPTSNDPCSPTHYTRDPHRLTAYLVPFPKPHINGTPPDGIPDRFLIYTPPPPPLPKPAEGEKEARVQKVQRKWQEEVRAAKTSTAKTASWKGVKSKATRGISKAVNLTTSSNLDFLNRVPDGKASPDRRHSEDDGVHEDDTTHKTVGLQEMALIYPSSYNATPEQVKIEFINSMMRSKSKAQRDAIIATGLLPVSAAIDILATVIWPFGGLLEVDGVWAYSSIRGAKTARSVTKRLTSSTKHGGTHPETEEQVMQGDKLRMSFQQDPRMEVLYRYLGSMCTKRDPKVFPSMGTATTESEVLEAIGWAPSQTGGEKNWEDEQWETSEVKDDLRNVMGKGAREWDKWCKAFEKSPQKALKK